MRSICGLKQTSLRPRWFSTDDNAEARKLIIKLDLLIVPYALLSYWIKYVDQSNLNNAYVSGLKEELGFNGNELVQLQTFYIIGAVTGQIPCMLLFTFIPMFWLIPIMDVSWGIFTLLQYRVTSFAELAAYRFLVGWCESAFVPAVNYVLGSWYREDEIARRGGVFFVGLPLGTLTAGLLQAAASANLDGVGGLAGWRWMYIICAAITIPIGVLGYVLLPGTPALPNRLFLRPHELELASERLKRAGHTIRDRFGWKTAKCLFIRKDFWALVLLIAMDWNAALPATNGGFLLWLKSLHRYSEPEINKLGTMPPALGILYTLIACCISDLLLGPAWTVTVAQCLNAIGIAVLVAWSVPEPALWFGFALNYTGFSISSVLYGWMNIALRSTPAERAFALVLANALAQSTTAWTSLLAFPTVEAPRFRKGYIFCLVVALFMAVLAPIIALWLKKPEPCSENVDLQLPESKSSTKPKDPETSPKC